MDEWPWFRRVDVDSGQFGKINDLGQLRYQAIVAALFIDETWVAFIRSLAFLCIKTFSALLLAKRALEGLAQV